MSTNSFKRLTLKARRSLSGLNPFCDSHESSDKENEDPDLEEFGYPKSPASSKCSDFRHSSPLRDSPSRRTKLLGSLRSISSLRSLRSSPLKERGKEQAANYQEPKSPQTPVRTSRPSLALNFEQSPPDKPMFEVTHRRRSISSASMVVNHSSSVPIPTPAKQEDMPFDAPAFLSGFPIGTVPTTPGPLQAALERDPNQSAPSLDPSPARPATRGFSDALPTPMPGTNLGFSDNDLNRASQGERGFPSSEPPTEPAGYFSIPVREDSSRTASSELVRVVDRYLDSETQDGSQHSSSTGERSSSVIEHDEHAVAGQQSRLKHRCDPIRARCNHRGCEKQRTRDAGFRRELCAAPYQTRERVSTTSDSSALNIDHIVFDDDLESTSSSHTSNRPVLILRRNTAQASLRTVESDSKAPYSPAHSALEVDSVLAQATWGTRGSLYDGNGYGDSSGSNSTRPSTSSRVPEAAATKATDEMMYTSALRESVHDHDHENLEEAIRAFAALEAASGSRLSEDMLEEVVADVQADVELANQMADYSLGA